MAETKIEWARFTFNPWRGCARVSAGCDHCYAEAMSKRNPKVLGIWGEDGTRVVAAEAYWRAPLRWNAAAERSGERPRVFCASLADWLEDRRDLDAPRHRLFDLIEVTPSLDWMLLTKRPENFDRLAPGGWVTRSAPAHVQLGVTAEDQPNWDRRVRILQWLPARIRFVSAEPLLGPITCGNLTGINQVIIGGESGGGARAFDLGDARGIVAACKAAGVAVFVKQLGKWPSQEGQPSGVRWMQLVEKDHSPSGWWAPYTGGTNSKHGDLADFPADLRIREFPERVNA